jgi:hypothetical protein
MRQLEITYNAAAWYMKHKLMQVMKERLAMQKISIHGSCDAINEKHLPGYLAEFHYRFNRRLKLEEMIPPMEEYGIR